MGRRCRIAVAVLAFAVVLFGAPAARAASVYVESGQLQIFDGIPGAANVITIDPVAGEPTKVSVRDAGAPMTGLEGCTGDSSLVTCTVTSAAPNIQIVVYTFDGNDHVTVNVDMRADIFGGAGNDVLQGGPGVNQVYGEAGDDTLRGGGGDEVAMRGGPGADDVDGEDGSDVIIDDDEAGTGDEAAADGGDVYVDTGTVGTDFMTYGGPLWEDGVRITVADEPGNDGENAGLEGDSVGSGFEYLQGTYGDDVIEGGAANETINGSGGDDDLTGGGGVDRVEGNRGTDVLRMQDGVVDGAIYCDAPSDPADPASGPEQAYVDAGDPAVTDCELVSRTDAAGGPAGGDGGGGQPGGGAAVGDPARLPAARSAPRLSGAPVSGQSLTCDPGTWSGEPTLTYAWFVPATTAGQRPRKIADGRLFAVTDALEGGFIYCLVTATNARGSVSARSASTKVPTVERMPNLVGKPVYSAKEMLADTYGTLNIGSEREQDKLGRGIDMIPCAQGGTKGSCSSPKLKPGEVFATEPKAGTALVVFGLGAPTPRIKLHYYDAGKDEAAPKAGSPRRWGNNCPLRSSYDDDRRDAWVDSFIGMKEEEARKEAARVECDVVVKAKRVAAQESDPYVEDSRVISRTGERKLELRVKRPPGNDISMVIIHRRIYGADKVVRGKLVEGPLNPGIGRDGRLTVSAEQENDMCIYLLETATGRGIPGAELRFTDPSGEPVKRLTGSGAYTTHADAAGWACARLPVRRGGVHVISARYAGANGVDLEGRMQVKAIDREKRSFVTVGGRVLTHKRGEWVQTAIENVPPTAKSAGVLEDLGAAFRALIAPVAAVLGGAYSSVAAAFAGGESRVSFKIAEEKPAPKPGFLAGDKLLDPTLKPPALSTGTHLVGMDGATLVGMDGATLVGMDGASLVGMDGGSIVAAGAGNLVAAGGGNLVGMDGGSLVAAGGPNMIGNAAGLIGMDGATLVAAGAGNAIAKHAAALVPRGGNVIEVAGRAVAVDARSNLLAGGTIVAAGAGNALPVAPLRPGARG